VALALALFAGAAVYLSLLPRNLNWADESYFLYEAKRLRDGELLYRDVFEFVTPLAGYAMAALFWLCGTTLATARISMACLHALTGAVLYATSRRLDVRMELALLVPLAYLVGCEAVWPYASWHWFSTCLTAILLWSMVAAPWATRARWAFVPGLVSGALIGVQQQRGVVLAAGTALVLVLDFLVDRRFPQRASWQGLAARLAYFAAGVATVVVPMLLTFAALAGSGPLYDALVRFPLDSYRTSFVRPSFRRAWGAEAPLHAAEYTYGAVLTYSPLAVVLPIAMWASGVLRGRDRQAVRQLSALIVLCVFSALSIRYYPDVIHIAFIAGMFWVAAAVSLEWILNAVRPPARSRRAGVLVAAVLGAGLVLTLVRYARLLHQQYPIAHQTAFGRIDFHTRWEPLFIDTARELLAATPSRELFCYPQLSAPYLTTGAHNPTPYQFLLAGVSPQHQIAETLRILETRRVPYVIGTSLAMRSADPIVQYIREHYEPVAIPEMATLGELPMLSLYRRKDQSPAEDGAAVNDDRPREERAAAESCGSQAREAL
jgi:hypothetical protein